MGSASRLEDFGILNSDEEQIAAQKQKCRHLPPDAQAMSWRQFFKDNPHLYKIMNGQEYKEAQRRLRVVRR